MAAISRTTSPTLPASTQRPGWERPPLPWWTHPLSLRLYLLAVFLIPVQISNDSLASVVDTRLSPTDLLLGLSVALAPMSVRLVRQPLLVVPLGLPVVLAYGLIVALLIRGEVSDHAITVKFLGAFVLVVLALVTMGLARAGFARYILRVFLLGVLLSAVIGYIDWKFVDIIPAVEHGNPSRFVALVADPNNAGALFGMSLMISARCGRQLFKTRVAWLLATATLLFALTQTLSRGAFIGVALGTVALLIVDRVSAERWLRLALIGAFGLGLLLASGFVDTAADDFDRRPDNVGDRENLVDGAVELWVDSGGFGAGLGTIRLQVGEIVHNTGVWLVAEMSVPGLLYLLAVLAVPSLACLRLRRSDEDLAMGLLGAHAVMAVASVGIEGLYQRGWWVVMGCMVLPAAAGTLRRRPPRRSR